jgi:hypothetical protein
MTLCTVVSRAVTVAAVIKGERNDVPNLGVIGGHLAVVGQGLDNRKRLFKSSWGGGGGNK